MVSNGICVVPKLIHVESSNMCIPMSDLPLCLTCITQLTTYSLKTNKYFVPLAPVFFFSYIGAVYICINCELWTQQLYTKNVCFDKKYIETGTAIRSVRRLWSFNWNRSISIEIKSTITVIEDGDNQIIGVFEIIRRSKYIRNLANISIQRYLNSWTAVACLPFWNADPLNNYHQIFKPPSNNLFCVKSSSNYLIQAHTHSSILKKCGC